MNSAGFGRCGSVAVQVRFSAVQCGSVRFVRLGAVHAVHAVGLRLGAVVVLVSPDFYVQFPEKKSRKK